MDSLGSRYHQLPSKLLQDSTTLDLDIMVTANKWEIKNQKDAESGQTKQKDHGLSQEQMLEMIERAKNKK